MERCAPQCVLRSLAHADVADRRRHQDTFGAFQRAQHELDRKLASVLAPRGELDPGTDLLRQRLCHGSTTVRDQPFREALRNDVGHLLPEEFIAPVSELLLRLNVQQHDFSALVHHHHRVWSRLQQPAVLALHLRQMLFRGLALGNIDETRTQKIPARPRQPVQPYFADELPPLGVADGALERQSLAGSGAPLVFLEALRDRAPVRLTRWVEFPQIVLQQFIPRVSEQLFGAGVGFDEAIRVQIENDNSLRRLVDQQTIGRLALRECGCMFLQQLCVVVIHCRAAPLDARADPERHARMRA